MKKNNRLEINKENINEPKTYLSVTKNTSKIYYGLAIALVFLFILCFCWAFVNIGLFANPSLPNKFNVTTPIYKVMLDSEFNTKIYAFTANGYLFFLANIALISLIIFYSLKYKLVRSALEQRINNKIGLLLFIIFFGVFAAMYVVMFLIAFIPPNNGMNHPGNFTALFNVEGYDSQTTVKNAGYYVVVVLFTISLLLICANIIFYFFFNKLCEQKRNITTKLNQKKLEKQKNINDYEKFSLRTYFAKLREAKKAAKEEEKTNNSLKQNLIDVALNDDIEKSSTTPEIVEVDQKGNLKQIQYDELPKMEKQDELSPGLNNSEPRRLGKIIANIKNKNKEAKKSTNINKKATVAAPTKEINDLVKKLLPD